MPEQPPSNRGGEYADVVAQIMDRDAAIRRRAEEPREPRDPTVRRWLAVVPLAVVFVFVWVGALREMSAPPDALPPDQAEFNERIKTFAVALEIRRFERERGRLPSSLDEIGFGDSGLRLVVSGSEWRLEEEVAGEVIEVESGDDPMQVILDMVDEGGSAPPGSGGMR